MTDREMETNLTKALHPRISAETAKYIRGHLERFRRVFDALPRGNSIAWLLDVGGTGNLLPMYIDVLQYAFVAMANKWQFDALDADFMAQHVPAARFRCDYFDAEAEAFPYENETFDAVVCSEVLEHLRHDPMHMLSEINRALKPGGVFILTTPNIASHAALYRLLSGKHPQMWSQYYGPSGDRHNREYAPKEVERMLMEAGFGDIRVDTFSLRPSPPRVRLVAFWTALPWIVRGDLDPLRKRGEFILGVARKRTPVRDRYPAWLYGKEG
jgi:2-polyprenyl-3-methyl-5-hydroxy-6-metoxy-1,4-benzoquinol methylase